MPKSTIDTINLEQYFENNSDRAFAFSDLESVFLEHGHVWNLPRSMTPQTFVKMLLSKTKLRELRLRSSNYPRLLRYTWGSHTSPISVAVSIKNGAFFSHASAMWVHGLNPDHKNIFVNKEQSEKCRNAGQLSQEAIHRAFRNRQRRSKLAYKYRDVTITVLSGKHTGRLEVEHYFFWTGKSTVRSAKGKWQRRLHRLFELAKVQSGHAHRFRDTFAVELLLAGVPLDRVSVLLGHSSIRITERHYAPWTRSRQEQIEADLKAAWSNDPVVLTDGKGMAEMQGKTGQIN